MLSIPCGFTGFDVGVTGDELDEIGVKGGGEGDWLGTPATPLSMALGDEDEDEDLPEQDPAKEVRFHTPQPERPETLPTNTPPISLPQRPKRSRNQPDRFVP